MTCHTLPKDDAWRLVTPLSVEALGHRLWLRCKACGHDLIVPAVEYQPEKRFKLQTSRSTNAIRLGHLLEQQPEWVWTAVEPQELSRSAADGVVTGR